MRINTNLTAMNTYTQYTKNNSKISSAVAKLSSGYSINSAADNAAGLAISEKMRAQIRGLNQASTNSQDAISLTQTAEGALSSSTEILQRMREISVQSSNDTNNTKVDREALQDEFSQLQNELNDIASTTSFNKKNLLDGSLAKNTATITNMNMAKSGLSVDLGKVSAGSYAFSVNVKQETAAVAGKASAFTVSSNSSNITVGTVTPNLEASALANGNYTVSAKYNSTSDGGDGSMTITAKGDNNQTFTATVSASDLKAKVNIATPTALTLDFKNSDSTKSAFSFDVTVGKQYDTDNSTAMTSLANEIGSALSLSASGGVDKQDATYGLYAKMTGAEDVKLAAGMDSVTFSNGVKVGFNKLTTTDVNTANKAVSSADLKITVSDTTATTPKTQAITFAKEGLKVSDQSGLTDSTLTLSSSANGKLTLTSGEATAKTYNATLTSSDVGVDAKTGSLTFVNATDSSDTITLSYSAAGVSGWNGTMATTAATVDTAATNITHAGEHASDATFGTAGKLSTFDVENKKGAGLTFQVGANEGDELVINVDKMDANYLGVASASVSTREAASKAITSVDNAINQVSSQRAYMGAIQNRLNYKISNLNTSSQNLTAAESQIRDVDMAKEMTEFTNANILSQAATSMLAQANSLPQNVLSLLK